MSIVKYVPPEHIIYYWPKVKHFIERAFDEGFPYDKDFLPYTIEHMIVFLTLGQWALLLVVDDTDNIIGAFTMSFTTYPKHRVACITAGGGKALSSKEITRQVKEFAASRGATMLQACCRKSLVRLMGRLGFEPRNTIVECKI